MKIWPSDFPECNLGFHARYGGSLHSPDYPHYYEANRVCSWTITADLGYRVQLTFTDFHLQNTDYTGQCHDFVLVSTVYISLVNHFNDKTK